MNKANNSPVGRHSTRNMIADLLSVTLQTKNSFKKNKKLNEYCNENPTRHSIFTLDMPHTCARFLHRLLSLDPTVRSLL